MTAYVGNLLEMNGVRISKVPGGTADTAEADHLNAEVGGACEQKSQGIRESIFVIPDQAKYALDRMNALVASLTN